MSELRKYELLHPMQDNDEWLQDRIAKASDILSIVHEGNNPGVCLRNDKIIHIKEDGNLVHWKVMSD